MQSDRFPDADYFGGRILPDWGNAKPRWIRDEPLPLIDGVLGLVRSRCRDPAVRSTEPPPFGASFAIRRRLFEKIGLFRVDLGTGGTGLGRGEETEFLMRARDVGAQGVYVGEALCFHAYDPRRVSRLPRCTDMEFRVAGRTMQSWRDPIVAVIRRRHGSCCAACTKR